jgi:F-type H+-transporting ATPase subunit delta
VATQENERLAVARVWSSALLDLAAANGQDDALRDELDGLVELLDRQPALESLLSGPVVEDEVKRALLERSLRGRASDLLVDALQVLRRKKRLDILRAVAATYRQAWLERRGRVQVDVTTAAPLSDALRAELQRSIDRASGKKAEITARVDPELLGGMVLRFDDQRFDTSLAAELTRLEHLFLERASRELQAGNLAHDGLDDSDRNT